MVIFAAMKRLLPLLAGAMFVALSACTKAPSYQRLEGSTWNTLYHIIYRSSTNLDDSVRATMRRVEMSLSPFAESSLISRVNRGESVVADSMLTLVFETSKRVNRLSGGMFDPTVAPLVNLWGFGYRDNDGDRLPSRQQIDSVLGAVGIDRCSIDPSDGTIVKKSPLTEFNFSAITKGFGCDMVAAMFERNGVTDYMIEIGGEIAMRGVNGHSQPWRVQVDKPILSDSAIIHEQLMVITPGNNGVATSGNYRNYRRDESGRHTFGHTISPVTGQPVQSRVVSATVIAPTCMMADALATACMAMHPDSALAMIDALPDIEALLITNDRGDEFVPVMSRGFDRFVAVK